MKLNKDFKILKDPIIQLSPSTIKLMNEIKNLNFTNQEKLSKGLLTIFYESKK